MSLGEKANTGSSEWIEDCMRWRGEVLTGKNSHWCYDWDFLPVDETTPEWETCTCYPAPEEEKRHA